MRSRLRCAGIATAAFAMRSMRVHLGAAEVRLRVTLADERTEKRRDYAGIGGRCQLDLDDQTYDGLAIVVMRARKKSGWGLPQPPILLRSAVTEQQPASIRR